MNTVYQTSILCKVRGEYSMRSGENALLYQESQFKRNWPIVHDELSSEGHSCIFFYERVIFIR